MLLAESHASLHAWPEYDYCAIDVFTCNLELDISGLVRDLQQAFGAKGSTIRKIDRLAMVDELFPVEMPAGEGTV